MNQVSYHTQKDVKQILFVRNIVGTQSLNEAAMTPTQENVTPSQAFSQVENERLECLCRNTFPVFQLNKLIGLCLISTRHSHSKKKAIIGTSETEQSKTSTPIIPNYCHSTSYLSLPSLTNTFFTIVYSYLTVWIYHNLGEHLGQFFKGVDFYTLAVDVVSNFIATTILLFHARFKSGKFLETLHNLQSTYSLLRKSNSRFVLSEKLRLLSMFLVVFIVVGSFVYGTLFLYLIFGKTVPYTSNDRKVQWLTFIFVFQKLGHFLLPLYPQSFVALFIMCTEVVRQLYIESAHQLQVVLDSAKQSGGDFGEISKATESIKFADGIERCRLVHEKLMTTVGALSEYFGMSLLTICTMAVLSLTAAIYTIILNKADIPDEVGASHQEIVGFFYVVWGFHLFFACFVLGGILLSGQRVTDANKMSSRVIQKTPLNNIDANAKFQITLLSQALYGEPAEISACGITKMSMVFLASAVGNITTYILVLLQFRWSGTDQKVLKNETLN